MSPENLRDRFAGLSVLIAEDEPRIRRLLEIVLTAAGFNVLLCVDGQNALELSRGHNRRIDLLVANINMPRLDGVHLAEQLRAERPEIKVLIISGETSAALERLSATAEFLKKPFVPSALLEKVASILEARSEQQAAV